LRINTRLLPRNVDKKSLIFAFDESIKTIFRRTKTLGMPVQQYVESGQIKLQQIDPAEVPPGEFTYRIVQAVKKESFQLVIIDSLNGYWEAMPNEKFLSLQLHELLTYLGQQGIVSVVTLAQHGLVGAMQSPVDVTYLSDAVILLRYFEAGGRVKKAISVMKKRSGVHEDSIREFKIDNNGLRVGEPLVDFHGVLTGVPTFRGKMETMLKDRS